VEAQAREEINQLNDGLRGFPFKLAVVPIEKLVFLEKNARYMTNEQFQNLVKNVKQDGGLSSLPFCVMEGEKYKVLSGNHRGMAAKEAGLTEVLVLYTDKKLSQQEQVAIQLSHNSIVGQDDPVLLKELWSEIEDIGMKYYAGLDDKVLKELENVKIDALSEVNLDFRTMTFVFLPEEVDRLEEAFKAAIEQVLDKNWTVSRFQEFNRLMDAMSKSQSAYNIRNNATSMMLVLDVFEKHITDLAQGWEKIEQTKNKQWVPLASIFNTDKIPIETAKLLKKAVERMAGRDRVPKNELWRAMETWALDYLGGG